MSTIDLKKLTYAGFLVSIGIVFGDIGTSPLYTLNAVFHNKVITETIALGSLSCIFWTLFFQTTSPSKVAEVAPVIFTKT